MNDELLNQLVKTLQDHALSKPSATATKIINSLTDDSSIPFRSEQIHSLTATPSKGLDVFIDGGNAPLFSSNALFIDYQKIAVVCYLDQRRSSIVELPYLVVLKNQPEESSLSIAILEDTPVSFHSPVTENPPGDAFVEEVIAQCQSFLKRFQTTAFLTYCREFEIDTTQLAQVAQQMRYYLEQEIALTLSTLRPRKSDHQLNIIMDGALVAPSSRLRTSSDSMGPNNHVTLTGICKTTDLLSDTAEPASCALRSFVEQKITRNSSWLYGPLFETVKNSPLIGMAKLHQNATHVFRIDFISFSENGFVDVVSQLQSYANDPVFVGYPYPLIEADKHARISNDTISNMRTHLLFVLQHHNLENITAYELSANAHSILDSLEF